MTVTDTTWTCPSHGCGRTVVVYACPEDTAWLIRGRAGTPRT